MYLYILQELWVDPDVHKSKWSFLFIHNWTTAMISKRTFWGLVQFVH